MNILKRIGKKKDAAHVEEKEVQAVADAQATKAPKKATAKKAAAKAESAAPAVVASRPVSLFATATIIAPIITEKAAHLAEQGVYVFQVAKNANRVAVAQAFKEMYKVAPTGVNIQVTHGKEHRFGGTLSRSADSKKALVTVPKGTRIDIFNRA